MRCLRCGHKGITKITNFNNLTISLNQELKINSLQNLIQRHFKKEIIKEVYCGFCSWKRFKDMLERCLGNIEEESPKVNYLILFIFNHFGSLKPHF